jgi:hypothetical protein
MALVGLTGISGSLGDVSAANHSMAIRAKALLEGHSGR